MPNEGKSVEHIITEWNGIWAVGGRPSQYWLRQALAAIVLGAVEKATEACTCRDHGGDCFEASLDEYRQALITYAQEIAKDV